MYYRRQTGKQTRIKHVCIISIYPLAFLEQMKDQVIPFPGTSSLSDYFPVSVVIVTRVCLTTSLFLLS